jgi:hypothetical protein
LSKVYPALFLRLDFNQYLAEPAQGFGRHPEVRGKVFLWHGLEDMRTALPEPIQALGWFGQEQVYFVLHTAYQGAFEFRAPEPGKGWAAVLAGLKLAPGNGY